MLHAHVFSDTSSIESIMSSTKTKSDCTLSHWVWSWTQAAKIFMSHPSHPFGSLKNN